MEEKEIRGMTIAELKEFLKLRGQPRVGNKTKLIARALGCLQIGLSFAEKEVRAEGCLSRQFDLLETPTGQSLPHPCKIECWTSVTESNTHAVTEQTIYNYIVLSRHRSADAGKMAAEKVLPKAKHMSEEGHVHNLMYSPVSDDTDHGFFKGAVMPSLPSKDATKTPDYAVWICLSKVTGHVHSAYCSCTAGEAGSCNHIGAVMYKLMDLSEKKENGLLASTSQKNKWLQPRKRNLSLKKVVERPLRRQRIAPSHSEKVVVNFLRLRMKLESSLPSCCYVNITSEKPVTASAATFGLQTPQFSFCDHVDFSSSDCTVVFEKYVEDLAITAEDIKTIEAETRSQAKALKWHKARQGRLTSSEFKDVICRRESTEPDNMVKRIMGYVPNVETKATKHGKEKEKAARRQYFNRLSKDHPHMSLVDCGLVIDQSNPYLATSPDGLVNCPCPKCFPGQGLVEVKCPFRHRFLTVEEICKTDKDFCCFFENGKVQLKRTHRYYFQIQGQMGITGRKWCDFVVWTMSDDRVNCMTVERIHFDEKLWKEMTAKLRAFFVKAVVPEMFSARVQRQKPLYC